MAEVKPFQGVRYNTEQAGGDLTDLVCPPYDVISPDAQQAYLTKNPHNVVRLELGEILPTDDSFNNRYTRAATALDEWLGEGVLFKEQSPAYYLHEQEFESNGQPYTRRALLAAVQLHAWEDDVILPHERTLHQPKADRLALLQATKANLSPVFCVYDDADGHIASIYNPGEDTQQLYEFKDSSGCTNRLFLIDQPDKVGALEYAFGGKKLYMADGHHRYETALAYRDERRATGEAEGGSADYLLMALSALQDPGLVVLPYHREVQGLSDEALHNLSQTLPQYFGMEEASVKGEDKPGEFMAELVQKLDSDGGEENHVFGMYGAQPGIVTILKLKSEDSVSELMPPHSEAWQKLDVSIFQTVILEGCLGMTEESVAREQQLTYTRDVEAGVARIERGETQRLFIMPPTLVTEMVAVAENHDQMPPKSTYFYPKFQTGMVMRLVD